MFDIYITPIDRNELLENADRTIMPIIIINIDRQANLTDHSASIANIIIRYVSRHHTEPANIKVKLSIGKWYWYRNTYMSGYNVMHDYCTDEDRARICNIVCDYAGYLQREYKVHDPISMKSARAI